jgi:radical SAM superfamily enzyme YgiQ (UPF0313 family)
MKKAGCYAISLGIESGNQVTLDRMKKGATLEQAARAVQLIRQAKIRTYLMYIIGFPWEDRKMVEDTIDFAVKLDGDITQFFLAYPFYGTELVDMAEKEGWLLQDDRFFHDYRLKRQYLSDDEIEALYRQAWRRVYLRPRFIMRSLRFALTDSSPRALLRLTGVALRQFGNFLRYRPTSETNPEAG